jgi:hypothetical protein
MDEHHYVIVGDSERPPACSVFLQEHMLQTGTGGWVTLPNLRHFKVNTT